MSAAGQAVLLSLALAGTAYFLVRVRIFDVWALAFFGCCFYFLPGYFGFVAYAEGILLSEKPVLPETYAVMILVQGGALAGGVMSDLRGHSVEFDVRPEVREWRYIPAACVLLGGLGMLLSIYTTGDALFAGDKFALIGQLNRWHLLWTTGASIGLVAAVDQRMWGWGLAALLLHGVNLWVGFRVDFVIAVVAAIFVVLRTSGPQRLIKRWRVAAGVVSLALALFFLKYFLVAIQLMDWELLLSQARNPDLVRSVFLYSEPFVAQGTLNEVIATDFWVGPGHLANIGYLVVPFSNELGASTTGFSDLFQPTLFSSVTEFGLGSNIWAEMLASGGWPLFLSFLVASWLVLLLLERLFVRYRGLTGVVAVVLIAYWAFYIHRNDILYQLTLTRRLAMAGIAVGVVVALCAHAVSKIRIARSHLRRSGTVLGEG